MVKRAALLFSVCFIAAPVWAINKCSGPDGKVTFQETPCQGSGSTVAEDMARKERAYAAEREKQVAKRIAEFDAEQKKAAEEAQAERGRRAERQKDEEMLARHCGGKYLEVRLGLTENQVRYCTSYGAPKSVNTTKTPYGVKKQYVYSTYGRSYLYFENGLLTAIQD